MSPSRQGGLLCLSLLSENGRQLGSYAIVSDNRALTELAVAKRQVLEINPCVDCQRQLIEQLASEGHDIASAKIVLDSL